MNGSVPLVAAGDEPDPELCWAPATCGELVPLLPELLLPVDLEPAEDADFEPVAA